MYKRSFAAILLSLTLSLTMAMPGMASDLRGALWKVEQVCMANKATTGLSFPCLDVNPAQGYVVLRAPVGQDDMILAPTEKISGIEAASLLNAGIVNYFEPAWNARALLADKTRRKLTQADFALAINSYLTRSQDQLHIHIDCIATDVQRQLRAIAPDLPANTWVHLPKPIRNLSFWARRIPQETLAGVNPFALVASGVPEARLGMGQMTLVITGNVLGGNAKGYILLAAKAGRFFGKSRPTGEDLLDHECRA